MTKTQSSANPQSVKLSRYDVADHLRSPEEMADYLDAWLDEFPDDVSGIARAVGDIARAKGMTQVASDLQLRHSAGRLAGTGCSGPGAGSALARGACLSGGLPGKPTHTFQPCPAPYSRNPP